MDTLVPKDHAEEVALFRAAVVGGLSFLIDKQGTIRFVHPGPEYAAGSDDAKNLRAHIEELLKE